jgi:hypothetical protein
MKLPQSRVGAILFLSGRKGRQRQTRMYGAATPLLRSPPEPFTLTSVAGQNNAIRESKYAHLWICYCRCNGNVGLASQCSEVRNWARRRSHWW